MDAQRAEKSQLATLSREKATANVPRIYYPKNIPISRYYSDVIFRISGLSRCIPTRAFRYFERIIFQTQLTHLRVPP